MHVSANCYKLCDELGDKEAMKDARDLWRSTNSGIAQIRMISTSIQVIFNTI